MYNVRPKHETYDGIWNPWTRKLAMAFALPLSVLGLVFIGVRIVGEEDGRPAMSATTSSPTGSAAAPVPSPIPPLEGSVLVTQVMTDKVADTIAGLYARGEYDRIGFILTDLERTTGCKWFASPGYAEVDDLGDKQVRRQLEVEALAKGVNYVSFGKSGEAWVAVLVVC